MKKNLRSKILLCVLAGGVLAANTALAAEYTETIKDDITFNNGDVVNVDNIGIDSSDKELTVTVNGNVSINAENMTNDVTGVKIENNNMIINGSDDAKLKIIANGGERAVGIYISSIQSETIINPDLEIKVSNNLNSTYDGVYGIYDAYSNTKFNGDINIEVNSDFNNEVSALYLRGDKFEFNGDVKAVINSTKDITVTSNKIPAAIHTSYSSETVFNKTVDLTFNANTVLYPIAGVISIISNPDDGNNILTFNDETKITVNNPVGMAVGVFCSGAATFDYDMDAIVNFRDDVYIETSGLASVAILAQEDSVVDISKAELSNTAENAVHGVIKGDIQSGTGIYGAKGYVNLNFTGADSLIESDIFIANNDAVADLALHDGAVWRTTGFAGHSLLTNLLMDNGVVEQNNAGTIGIRNYSGNGDINFKAQDTDNNGVLDFTNTGDVTIESAEEGSSVNLGVINNTVNTLDIEKTEENLNAIAEKIVYVANDGKLGGKVTVKEGLITPEASGDLLFYEDDSNGHTAGQGYVANVKQNSSTTTIDNIKNVAATAIVAWRQEDSTLSQRLGELRESDGGQGIWVRMSRGEFEYDGEYKNQYNFFQMGYDWAAGSWHYGAAVSHNDGQTTYTHGDGENRSTSLSLYGTWLGDKGHYADIVLKQGRLSNDFNIYTEAGHTSGDYDSWGTSLSGEYGMKVDFDGGWYVTPQAQLTLMRIGGEDYTTNNGIKVNQDSLESAVGRVGFEVGKRISDSGSIYAKASLLHDFAGSADTYLSLNGLTNSYHQDIGDTWCEAGIGFNYKTSENSYVYADVVKTFGGDVETPWQWNAGMRWTF